MLELSRTLLLLRTGERSSCASFRHVGLDTVALAIADNLTSQITQLAIDIPHALIDISSLIDASHQHYNVQLDPLNNAFHHALDHIVDLVDALDLCVAVWFGKLLLDSSLEPLGFLLSGCCAVGVRAARVHASGFQGPQRVAAGSAAVGSQPSFSTT